MGRSTATMRKKKLVARSNTSLEEKALEHASERGGKLFK